MSKILLSTEAKKSHAATSHRGLNTYTNTPLTPASQTLSTTTKPFVQPKLKIGAPNDKYEQEADSVAEQVMRMPEPRLSSPSAEPPPENNGSGGNGIIQRTCASSTKKYQTVEKQIRPAASAHLCLSRIQAKMVPGHTTKINPNITSTTQALNAGGHPLSKTNQSFFGSRFGYDFSQVKIHSDRRAAMLADSIHASAFTLGNNVVFGAGQYQPHTFEGQRLMAHELTHVIQQQTTQQQGVIQRHPIYISRHGNQPHLQNANTFFQQWGYGPIRTGVDSIEEILADLAQQSSIGHITIVSHAHPSQLYLAMLNGGGSGIQENEWLVGDIRPNLPLAGEQQEQDNNILTRRRRETTRINDQFLNLERHFTLRSALAAAKRGLRRSNPELVSRIGNLNDSLTEQYIWWNVELYFVNTVNFTQDQKRQLRAAIEQKLSAYRDNLILASALSGAEISSDDFAALDQAIPEVLRDTDYSWPNLSTQSVNGDPSQRTNRYNQLRESPSEQINRVLRNQEFIDNLWAVKQRMSSDSWIEVQGCRLGSVPSQLANMQTFFAGDSAPRITAPDWFQAYGLMSWDELRNNVGAIRRWWGRQAVRQAFDYWFPVVTGQEIPDNGLTRDHFVAYLEAGNVLPVNNRFLVWQNLRQEAIINWLVRHEYRLRQAPDIEQQFFSTSFGQGMANVMIDYLQEQRNANSQRVFRPDPNYQRHIIST